jgi:hypothetical protein
MVLPFLMHAAYAVVRAPFMHVVVTIFRRAIATAREIKTMSVVFAVAQVFPQVRVIALAMF